MLSGHTQQTLGILEWRRRVVVVPQFHENYIFTGTLAFNLLMGRRWPPTSGDMMEAESLCRELGLGNLLDRMPAGLEQMVGESGWRLSHGERSRVYVARALLQNADLLILDESFGALDAESLQQTLDCVQRRVPSLVVIAHP
jgi:ABC-type multidrug transport system fused ATPase/permease subunit